MNRLNHEVRRRSAARGMTLIEMMVSLVIGMVLTLAVFAVMATFEGRRRTLTSTSDLDQAGSLALFQLDRWVRSAGSGFGQSADYAYGCALHAAKSGAQILPAGTLDAPFDAVNPGASGVFRLAPVMILPGQTTPGASGNASDVLALMSSGASSGEMATLFNGAAAAAQLTLVNSVAFTANDLVLLADQQPAAAGGVSPCLLTQAAGTAIVGTDTTMALSGTWYAATVATASVTGFSDTATAITLGNPGLNRPPAFQLVGVGSNNTLFSYDLLRTTDTPLQARGEGVFELHALYGVDTNGDGVVDSWVSPSSGSYTVASLSAGTAAAAGLLQNIKALRVGLILRTSLPEKEVLQSSTIKLFSDLGTALEFSRTLSTAEQKYRYRTMEATIPVRNNLL